MTRGLRIGHAGERRLSAEAGSYSLSGRAASLVLGGVGGRTLSAAQGTYTVAGQAATLVDLGPPVVYSDTLPIIFNDTGYGPDDNAWTADLQMSWRNPVVGDWVDRLGVAQGSAYFSFISVTTAGAEYSMDVTAIVQSGEPIILKNRNTTVRFTGRLHATPPRLVVMGASGPLSATINGFCYWNNDDGAEVTTNSVLCSASTSSTAGLSYVVSGPEPVVSATLFLTCYSKSSGTQRVESFQCTANKPIVGGGGVSPTWGLAAEVGEYALPYHADVFQAGDFRDSNWFTNSTLTAAPRSSSYSSPVPLGGDNDVPTGTVQGLPLEYLPDRVFPESTMMRTALVHGQGRLDLDCPGISLKGRFVRSADAIGTANQTIDEMYVRSYMEIEDDFWTVVDGIKAGVGFDCRMGRYTGTYYFPVGGNGGTAGTGLKSIGSDGFVTYSGHSQRMHLGDCRPTGGLYQDYRPVRMMASHNGPFINTPFSGTEEQRRCGRVVIQKGVMHCIEWYIRMNDITGPYDALGNGVGVVNGVLTLWIDGVQQWTASNFTFRRHPEIGVMGPWLIWMHGGRTPAAVGEIMHYTHGSYVAAKRYIGPRPPAPAAKTLNSWTSVPGTNISAAPGPDPGSRFTWCGLAFDERYDTVWALANGGHGDSYENAAFRLALGAVTPAWETVEASDPDPGTGDYTYYPSGRPASSHSYYSLQMCGARNTVMRFGAGSTHQVGNAKPTVDGFISTAPHSAYHYQPITTGWRAAGTFPSIPFTVGPGLTVCRDPVTEAAYVFSAASGVAPRRYTHQTNAWTAVGAGLSRGFNECASAFDTTRGQIFLLAGVGRGICHTWNATTGVLTAVTMTGSDVATIRAGDKKGLGMVYVPALDAYIIKLAAAGGSNVYRINAATFATTNIATTGGSTIPAGQLSGSEEYVYNRIMYSPNRKGIYYFPTVGSNAWFLQLH